MADHKIKMAQPPQGNVDPAFKSVPQNKPYFAVWRVEEMRVVAVPKPQWGNFYRGDAYIVYSCLEVKGRLDQHIHFWLGSGCSQDESTIAAYKTVELDDLCSGSPTQHREIEGNESQTFLGYFKKGVKYNEGGVKSGLNHVDRDQHEPKLYQVKGKRSPRCRQVPMEWSSFNSGDVFINDQGRSIFVWNSSSSSIEAEVGIIGGGPVGLAIACSLAKSGQFSEGSICLIDGGALSADYQQPGPDSYSNRVVALSNSSAEQLQQLGCHWLAASERVCPLAGMRVYESDSAASLHFNACDTGHEQMAFITELQPVVSELTQSASNLGVRLLGGSRVNDLQLASDSQRAVAKLNNGQVCVRARLIVGCDGYNSQVRQLAHIHSLQFDYSGSRAIVATVRLDSCHANVAVQRFLSNGLIALLPLANNGCYASLVWCNSSGSRAAELLAADEQQFVSELNRLLAAEPAPSPAFHLPQVVGVQEGSRASFPLGFMHADHYQKGRVALAGDAAHRISPLAGLGANLGLEDGKLLSQLVAEAASNGADPADLLYLREYETVRQRQALPVIAVNESLRLLYSLDAGSALTAPLRMARSLGLSITNRLTPLKAWLQMAATTGVITLWPKV